MDKIYLCTNNDVVTGGVEATYQLYFKLKQLNYNPKLVLLDVSIHPQFHTNWLELHKQYYKKSYPSVYSKYNIDINDLVTDIEDTDDNLFIAPEIYPDMLSTFKHIQKAIWWLSVDNGLGQDQRNFIIERNDINTWHFFR